jgi:hypothetical protein
MTDHSKTRNRNFWREQAGLRTGLTSLPYLSFFSWFRQIRGDESLSRVRDPFSLEFSPE